MDTNSRIIYKPTKSELEAARNIVLPDTIDYGLKVLFCGINPGLYTAAVGNPYGRPGNRFWPTLYAAGFTSYLFHPSEHKKLLELGYGLTNVVKRATNSEAELTNEEFIQGGEVLLQKLGEYQPEWIAFVGIGAYRKAFNRPKATIGRQTETFGKTKIWTLPSPSGLNAHYSGEKLIHAFRELKAVIQQNK